MAMMGAGLRALASTGKEQETNPSLSSEEMERYDDPRYALAVAMRKEFKPVREICRKAGISQSTYYQWFSKEDRANLPKARDETVRKITELRADGWSDAAIATHFKKTRQWVFKMAGSRPKAMKEKLQYKTVTWRASVQDLAAVEKVARRAGATGKIENRAYIQAMLDMIAHGDLIVTSPGRIKTDDPRLTKVGIVESA
jgi:predicted DNA-binding transcriptional regulator AlpA